MGRLDDAAKLKVVELRKNGLSLRKIKAVLELENIKVSAQAIYLYLKEFQCKQGRNEDGTAPLALVGTRGNQGGRREGYSNLHLQQLLRDASRHAGYVASAEFAKQNGPAPAARTQPSGSAENSTSRRPEQSEQNKDDKDIQIVSVTSLAQNKQERSLQSTATGAAGVTVTGAYTRRRVTPSPATSPMLAARKRLLDKALSHRMRIRESYQQMASILRRDQSNSTGSDVRGVTEALPPSYDLTTQATQRLTQMRRSVDGQPGGASVPRRSLQSARPLHPPPRVDIRLPSPAPTIPTSQGSSGAVIQLQNSEGQVQEAGGGGESGLREQVQALGSEVHSLGLAVRMLAEQQSQQTQVQRQILSTLQTLSSRLGPCNSTSQQQQQQQQHTQKTSPPTLSAAATASTSYTQGTFTYSQGVYPQCSQAPSGFSQMDTPSLDTVEAFKLPGQSPSCVFPASSSADSLTHGHAHTEPYSPTYARQQSQTQVSLYSPTCGPMYSQSFPQTNRDMDKSADYQGTGTAGALQVCAASSQPVGATISPLTNTSQGLNIIKLETL
ncbi:uncharacterized protein LOC124478999 [Hypomesus transpacificus]|uniref:uncharacterized protein LOC124478999 n=1 Tax=Hypomesus transpacificus TaxID=137520 RepID=UPI001F07B92D|nr:uncharacterized protein LOC124478999 [Hypomesus transpacificus]